MSNRAEEEAKLIHIGATIAQLAQLFNLSQVTIRSRIVGRVSPSRPKGQTEKDSLRYHIRDVAPLLVTPEVDIEALLKSLTPEKFPPRLQDPFWKAQKSRLDVEERLGNLWNTERVVEVLADAFKPVRMSILMFVENIEQQTELTPRQRQLITDQADGLLLSLNTALIEQFKDYHPKPDEHGTPLDASSTVKVPVPGDKDFDDGFGDDDE